MSKDNSCPKCHGFGFGYPIKDGKPDYSHLIPCECKIQEFREERRKYLLDSCKFPPAAAEMTFKNFKVSTENKSAYQSAYEMATAPGKVRWLALIGSNGVGKTHLAVAICKAWVDAGIPARYMFVSLLLDELKSGFNADNPQEGYDAKFRYYCTIPLLLLDDYGAESKTAWVQEKLDALVDYRLMNNLSLLVTSNLTLEQMPARIRSRLFRHEHSIIQIGGEDYKLNAK